MTVTAIRPGLLREEDGAKTTYTLFIPWEQLRELLPSEYFRDPDRLSEAFLSGNKLCVMWDSWETDEADSALTPDDLFSGELTSDDLLCNFLIVMPGFFMLPANAGTVIVFRNGRNSG